MKNINNKVCVHKRFPGLAIILALGVVSNVDAASNANIKRINSEIVSASQGKPLVILSEAEPETTTRRKRVRRTGETTDPKTIKSVPTTEKQTQVEQAPVVSEPEPVSEPIVEETIVEEAVVEETKPIDDAILPEPKPVITEQVVPVIEPVQQATPQVSQEPIKQVIPQPVRQESPVVTKDVSEKTLIEQSAPVIEEAIEQVPAVVTQPIQVVPKPQTTIVTPAVSLPAAPEPVPAMAIPAPKPQTTIVTPEVSLPAAPEPVPAMVIPAPKPQTTIVTPEVSLPATPKPVPAMAVPAAKPQTTIVAPVTPLPTVPVPIPQTDVIPKTETTTIISPVVPVPTPTADTIEKQTIEVEPTVRKQVKRPRRPQQQVQEPTMAKPITPPETEGLSMARGQSRRSLPRVDFDSVGVHSAVDRWRIVDALGYPRNVFDPYSTNNPLKADKPIEGSKDWFFDLSIISDTLFESRYVPLPVGVATTNSSSSYDTLGNGDQTFINQNLEFEFVLYKGDTIFRPPDFEVRFIPVINYNRLNVEEVGVVKVDPSEGTTRTESFVGIQGLFVDAHLRDVSSRYDFDSLRIGIQPFNADFRGFLFLDRPFGLRLFGTRDNNIFQYNLAWFKRFDKDFNSGLNDVSELRDDDVFVGSLFWQDMPSTGFTSQFVFLHNRNTEGDSTRYDDNGFIQRPASLFEERGGRDYDVTYLGYNGDGHFGRINLSGSVYYALGQETSTSVKNLETDISAFMTAFETSMDFDWMRYRVSGFYGSGDEDPFDDVATGFDAVLENPQFAGTDSSYYLRQGTPFIGGGGVALSQRNGILNSLRSSKEQGQSNFVNPGVVLLGFGADWDLLPTLRLTANLNQLWFEDTSVLEVMRQQANIDKSIGTDISMQLTYRPLLSQNIVFQFSYAMLLPGDGYTQLFGDDEDPYSLIANLIFTY